MTPYEREYFVSRLRSGIYFVKLDNIKIKILPSTLEDEYEANEIFKDTYEDSIAQSIMTEEEMDEWMIEKGLWGETEENGVVALRENLEKLKVGIFQAFYDDKKREHLRQMLRVTEEEIHRKLATKSEYYSKTCEGLASQEKSLAIFSRCCFIGKEPVDPEYLDVSTLFYSYNQDLLREKQLRELARNDPWRLAWLMKDHSALFANDKDRDLTPDQKGILIWSNMYDNIQESMECPPQIIINDDDALDGWFITQRKKQESDKAAAEIERKTNAKIAGSDEIHIFTGADTEEAKKVHGMNSVHGDVIRKQRINTAKKKGVATDFDFQDRQLQMRKQQTQQIKDRK